VKNSDQKNIAAQALRALQLRRQLDRGEVSHKEYLARLNAVPASVAEGKPHTPPAQAEPAVESARISHSTPAARPAILMSALELLQLRRRLDNGELSRQEYHAQLHTAPESVQVAVETPLPAPTAAPAVTVPKSRKREIVTDAAVPARYMAMKCPGCTADLRIYDRTLDIRCSECGADVLVERDNCTISLRLLEPDEMDLEAGAGSSCAGELAKLQTEVARLITVKRAAGMVGLLSSVLSACAGIADMAAQRTDTATCALISGCALLGTIVCITRHTSKVRAQLTSRIHALTLTEE
jgi:ribosomal protein S27E